MTIHDPAAELRANVATPFEAARAMPISVYTSETFRQVTFSNTADRQINGEYAHVHSYRRVSPTQVDSVIVTAVYADPLQLERFFVRTGDRRPLIVFSHGVRMIKKGAEVEVAPPPPEEASPAAASTESPAPV